MNNNTDTQTLKLFASYLFLILLSLNSGSVIIHLSCSFQFVAA
jgi:hypothetical protein